MQRTCLIILFVVLCGQTAIAQQYKDPEVFAWKLSGHEILLELEDVVGKRPRGLYAIDPFKSGSKPVLLIANASRPAWSPKRNYFAYLKFGWLWIAQRNGKAYCAGKFPVNQLVPAASVVQWTWQEGFQLILRYPSAGTLVCDLAGLRRPLGFPRAWASMPPFGIFPLRRRFESLASISWDDIQAVRSMGCSPDGKRVVAEVSPYGPDDLRRNGKLYLYAAAYTDEVESELYWFTDSGFPKPGTRLTRTDDQTAEMKPLWSPTGDWIAFTAVHFDKGYVAPAVCRPDGSDYTELLPPKAEQYTLGWPAEWLPVESLDVKSARQQYKFATGGWGTPHVEPVEWSGDGRYLLLNEGDRFKSVTIARVQRDKWVVTNVGGGMGSGRLTASTGGIDFALMGPTIPGSCWVALEAFDRISLFDKAKNKSQSISLPKGMEVRWMDW
jgi:hypothetical protein